MAKFRLEEAKNVIKENTPALRETPRDLLPAPI
jgi:hypothetical protein